MNLFSGIKTKLPQLGSVNLRPDPFVVAALVIISAFFGKLEADAESESKSAVELGASFTGDFLANANGGAKTGSVSAGLLEIEFSADLEKIFGWNGASFFANAFYFHGHDLSEHLVGSFDDVSNIFSETDFNFFNIYLQQKLAEENIRLKIGQIAADDDFMTSEKADLFINSVFGPLPTLVGNIPAPEYPLAAPGFFLRSKPAEEWT